MKNSLRALALSLLALFAVSTASADSGTGVGLILGQPTGATAKFWIHPNQAIDAGLAWSLDSFFLIYGDYLIHFKGAFGTSDKFVRELEPYFGIGGVLFLQQTPNGKYFTSNGDSTGLGIRIPLGAEYRMHSAPVGFFAEIVPGMGVVPSTFAFVQGGIGARYYF